MPKLSSRTVLVSGAGAALLFAAGGMAAAASSTQGCAPPDLSAAQAADRAAGYVHGRATADDAVSAQDLSCLGNWDVLVHRVGRDHHDVGVVVRADGTIGAVRER
jgi:hypothetical protein